MIAWVRITAFNLFFYAFTFCVALSIWALARLGVTRVRLVPVLRGWGRGVRGAVALLLGGRIEVRGLENLPRDRPVLIVSKHQSELDIVMAGVLFPDVSAIAMAELKRYPFFATILRALDIVEVAVDQGPQGRTEQVVEGTRRIMANGRSMLVYPEGTLMKLGARERYRRGAGHIYTRLDVTAVPVAVSLGAIWPQRRWRKNIGRTGAIAFLEPIAPGLDIESFMAEIETRIETATMELIREHADGEDLAAAEARFAAGVNNEGEVAAPRAQAG